MPKLSVLIPIYNEADNISELYRRLKDSLTKDFADFQYEILFVDDGSKDDSFEQLKKLREQDYNVKIIQFSKNFGHHIAITAGLDYVEGDIVVMMDGDLQDQPEEMINLYRKLEEGNEVVFAKRVNKKFPFYKKMLSSLFNWIIAQLIQEKIVINSTIFRMMRKQVVESLRELREQNRYVIGLVGWVGYKHASQDVEHGIRFKGKTKYTLSSQFTLAINAIYSFSDYFLKIIIKVGLIFIFFSVLLVLFVLYQYWAHNITVSGWTSIMLSIFLVGGVQILVLGVIGQYIGRIYMEVKGRPLYIIRKFVK